MPTPRHVTVLVAAAALLGVGVGLVSLASATLPRHPKGRTITLIGQTTEQRYLDLDSSGVQGDQFLFHDVLRSKGKTVGQDGGACSAIASDGKYQCLVTFSLHGGQITAQGVIAPGSGPQATFVLAVNGGSGAYQGVGGQATMVQLVNDQTKIVLHLLP